MNDDHRYYLSPFLKSHSLHLVVGPGNTGKTTWALQMLALRQELSETYPWAQFKFGELPDTIWYVDLIKPRKDVLSKIVHLGLGEPSETVRRLRVLTYDQILESRPGPSKGDPITFADILMRIGVENEGQLPEILIVEGFSLLVTAQGKEGNAAYEHERLREIDESYLRHGGCLIGIATYSKRYRIAGSGIETPGTHVIGSFAASKIEIARAKRRGEYKIVIEGAGFARRLLAIEFDDNGLMKLAAPRKQDSAGVSALKRETTFDQILRIAIELSLMDKNLEFRRGDLVTQCRELLGIERATVDRWLKKSRETGSVVPGTEYGAFSLHPKPEPPTIN